MKTRISPTVSKIVRLALLAALVTIVGIYVSDRIHDGKRHALSSPGKQVARDMMPGTDRGDPGDPGDFAATDPDPNDTWPADPGERDRGVLDQLAKSGSDLSKPATIRHYIYVATERDASAVAATLAKDGYACVIARAGARAPHVTSAHPIGVLASITGVPSLDGERTSRALIEPIASAHNGYYDGWVAQVVR